MKGNGTTTTKVIEGAVVLTDDILASVDSLQMAGVPLMTEAETLDEARAARH